MLSRIFENYLTLMRNPTFNQKIQFSFWLPTIVYNIYRSLWFDPYPYPLFPNVNINTTKRWFTEPNIMTQLFSFSSSLICENIVLWQGSVHGKPDLPSEQSIFRYKICKDNGSILRPVDTSFGSMGLVGWSIWEWGTKVTYPPVAENSHL